MREKKNKQLQQGKQITKGSFPLYRGPANKNYNWEHSQPQDKDNHFLGYNIFRFQLDLAGWLVTCSDSFFLYTCSQKQMLYHMGLISKSF